MDNTNTTKQLKNIHKTFTKNWMDIRTDEDKERFDPLIQKGLNIVLSGQRVTKMRQKFIDNVLFFNPDYAPKINARLSHTIANTGHGGFIKLQKYINEKQQLTHGPIIETSTSVVQKTREPH